MCVSCRYRSEWFEQFIVRFRCRSIASYITESVHQVDLYNEESEIHISLEADGQTRIDYNHKTHFLFQI